MCLSWLVLGGCDGGADIADDAQPHGFERAVVAMGGADALSSLNQVEMKTTGNRRIDHQGWAPGDLMAVSSYATGYKLDVKSERLRMDTEHTPMFDALELSPASTYSVILDGEVGARTSSALLSSASELSAKVVASIWAELWLLNPHLYLIAALEDLNRVSEGVMTQLDGRLHQVLNFHGEIAEVYLFVDVKTGFITKLETIENNLLVRDVAVEVLYKGWESYDGIAFPRVVEVYVGGAFVLDEVRLDVAPDAIFGPDTFVLPPGVGASPLDVDGYLWGEQSRQAIGDFFHMGFDYVDLPAAEPELVELAPGVNLLPGADNSLAVIIDESIVLLEGGESPAHGSARLSALAEAYAGAEVTHLIQSHFHQDNAAGVRSIIAETGAELIVGYGVEAFWEATLAAPSTVRPDLMATVDIQPVITEVEEGGKYVLDTAVATITAYHVPDNPHAGDMLITTIEASGELFVYQSDLYNAGGGLNLVLGGPATLYKHLRDLGILDSACRSDMPLTIVPCHGSPISLLEAQLELLALGIDVGCPQLPL